MSDRLMIVLSRGQFHNTKCWSFKRQIIVLKHQKWCFTYKKFHKALLAFKTQQYGVYIA